MTAMKQCQIIFADLEKYSTFEMTKELCTFVHLNHDYMKHKYHSLFQILNNQLPNPSKITLEKSKRVSDRHKLIGNMICTTIRKSTNHFTIQDENTLHRSSDLLIKTISRKKLDFDLDKEAEVKIQLLNTITADISCKNLNAEFSNGSQSRISNNASTSTHITKTPKNIIDHHPSLATDEIIHPTIHQKTTEKGSMSKETPNKTSTNINTPPIAKTKKSKVSSTRKVTVQNVELLSSKTRLQEYASRIIRPNIHLEGSNMMKAIEILRSYKTPCLFIASAESESLIQNWQLHQGWKHFAKMFGSRDLLHNKINATYLIPLFSGDTSSGHWHLCIVQKLGRRDYKAWCVDSLGTGRVDNAIAHRIENAFSPGRGRFTWISCTCKRQEELECGPRTIMAMWTIQSKLHEGASLEEGIQSATLMQETVHLSTAPKIREKIANFVNTFRSTMITAPIRLRQRTPLYRAPVTNEASKNPIILE